MLCRALEFAQRPDYDVYRALLEKMRDRKVSFTSQLFCTLIPSTRPALHSQGHVCYMGMFVHILTFKPI